MVRQKNLAKPYGIFKGYENQKQEDFARICLTIQMLTDNVCGKNKGIIDDPIVLTVYSPDCPDLTIIDLPGITRIPHGDQPSNIAEITKNMVTKYCSDPRTVI